MLNVKKGQVCSHLKTVGLQLIRLNLLATHLILFCTSNNTKTPLLPTYGTSDMTNKSGFCAVNG